MYTVHEQEMLSIDELAELHAHTGALIASGILNAHERSHIIQVRDRLDAAIRRQRLQQGRLQQGRLQQGRLSRR